MHTVGLVVIGRNEGERLRRCLASAKDHCRTIVYVDSGSTDGSVVMARAMGVNVIELDTSIPFTAARARNEGVKRLRFVAPDLQFVQFVDGDCEVDPHWWETAVNRMRQRPELAAVCGRRREKDPHASVYNFLCDKEWDTPIGDADACGGDSMMRLEMFHAVGGFNPAMIAGEEPELCFRFRQHGWKIERIDAEMTLHDAAIFHWSQWWRREKRTGYATAEGYALHGKTSERYRAALHRSNWTWGLILPLLALLPAYWSHGWSLVLLLTYPIQWLRIARKSYRRRDMHPREAYLYASLLIFGKFPQTLGQIKFWFGRITHRPSTLIEYKGADPSAA